MKMPRDLVVFRRRIVVVSAILVALCTAACMTLLAVPLIRADMTARWHMLEEFSNQPFVIERAGAGSEADGTSGLVVTGPDISWCRVAVDEPGEAVAVECGGAAAVDRLSESVVTQLVSLRDEVGSQPFSFDGRKWIGLWQPLGAQNGAVTVSNGNVAAVEAAPTEMRVYTFLDVTSHGANMLPRSSSDASPPGRSSCCVQRRWRLSRQHGRCDPLWRLASARGGSSFPPPTSLKPL